MPDEPILDLARQVNPKAEAKDIVTLSGGFSSQGYKVKAGDDTFVLLVQREGAVAQSNYGHAYAVMKLLQKHGIGHAPQALWLKDDHSALAISYYDGTASDAFDFQAADVDAGKLAVEVMDNLLDVAAITQDEYKAMAAEINIEPLSVQTTEDAAAEYGTAWLEIIKQSCPDQAIVDWLIPRVERSVAIAGSIGTGKPTFGHGDPSNPNILLRDDGSFMLIDWDSARFNTAGPEFYVAYTTHLTDFMKPYRDKLISHVAERLGIPASEFSQRVHEFRRYSEVFDINWAAMMMAKLSSGEVQGDVNHFREIALERIAVYEESFGKN